MIEFSLENAASHKITVTSTASLLGDLIDTAGSVRHSYPAIDAVNLVIESGDVRMLSDGNTPTANNGMRLREGATYKFRGISFKQMKLIRAGGSNATVSVEIGVSGGNDHTTTVLFTS